MKKIVPNGFPASYTTHFRTRILLFAFLTTLLAPRLSAQTDTSLFGGLQARSIGPAGMSGRVAAIEVNPQDYKTIYVGASIGGVWKTTNSGVTWTPLFDKQNTSSIGSIALDPHNPNVVWVGTGEGNVRNSASVGRGAFKSLDGGKTWAAIGLEKTERIHRLLIDPTNTQVAYAAAMGTTWGENPERGVFKTSDGGKTWRKVLFVDERTGAADLVMDPQNPNHLLVSMWQHRRWPWFFQSGGPGSGLYTTSDGGESWKKLTAREGLPEGELGRAGIAFAPGNPNVVYALVEATESALLRSDDGGASWKTQNKQPGVNPRPFYFCDIRVNPKNENTVYRLQSSVDISIDAGKTFTPFVPLELVHPDHHALWISPDGKTMLNGNDGGLAFSYDGGGKWQFIDNLPLAQFYHVAVDMAYPYNIYGGLQDNGSWRGPSNSFKRDGIYNSQWDLVGFGDGFATIPDPENPAYGYGMSQGGSLFYFNYETAVRKVIVPTESDVEHRYNWNTGIALDPFDPKTVYYGSQFLHKSPDKGTTWQVISPDLTSNDASKQKFKETGGLTRDVTGAENHTTIMTIAPSAIRQGVIWVGTDDGNVQVTQDGGKSWKLVSASLSKVGKGSAARVPAGTWVPHVEASKFDASTAYVVFDDHRRSNWATYVLVTRDYGATWQSLATAEIDGYAHVIEQDPVDKNLLFLGTEFGLYASFNEGKNWMKWTQGLPTVPVLALTVHPRDHDLVIGTFGRALYVLDDIRPMRGLSKDILAKQMHVFDIADAYQFNTTFWAGSYITPGDGLFKGKSRSYGALISYVVNPDDSVLVKIGTTKEAKASIEILDKDNKVIRTLKGPMHKGINRINWDLARKEFKVPSYEEDKPDVPEKAGFFVLPGTYTVRIKAGKQTETKSFEVKSDPRLQVKPSDAQLTYELQMKAEKLAESLKKSFTQIRDSQKAILTTNSLAGSLDSTKAKALKESGQQLEKKLTTLLDKIMPDYSKKQGIYDRSGALAPRIGELIETLSSSYNGPTQAAQVLYDKLSKRTDALVNEVNQLYQQEVIPYQKQVETAGVSIFRKPPVSTAGSQ